MHENGQAPPTRKQQKEMLSRSSLRYSATKKSSTTVSYLASLIPTGVASTLFPNLQTSPGSEQNPNSGARCGGRSSSNGVNNRESMARLADNLPARFVSWPEFDALCNLYGVADSKAAANALAGCGAVVTCTDGVHGHAPQAIRDACAALEQSWEPTLEMQLRIAKLKKEVVRLRPGYDAQLSKCVTARRQTWSGFFAFIGVQLAVFSRLTYFDLDWDTMEPIAYFLNSGIGVLAFAFAIVRGFDFGNRAVDKRVVQSSYIKHPDVVKYFDEIEELEELEAAMRCKATWVRTGKIVKQD